MIGRVPGSKGVLDDPYGNLPSPECTLNAICTIDRMGVQ